MSLLDQAKQIDSARKNARRKKAEYSQEEIDLVLAYLHEEISIGAMEKVLGFQIGSCGRVTTWVCNCLKYMARNKITGTEKE